MLTALVKNMRFYPTMSTAGTSPATTSSSTTVEPQATSNSAGADLPEQWIDCETWKQALEAYNKLDFKTFREIVIRESERRFSEKIREYPHAIYPTLPKGRKSTDAMIVKINEMQKWCQDQGMDVIAFDTEATGVHMNKANGVLFRNAEDAMLFKLTWC